MIKGESSWSWWSLVLRQGSIITMMMITAAGDFAPLQVEIEAMMEALRSHGSTLFTNAIATSDLKYQLLSSSAAASFTIFAPKDSLLYALDMLADAPTYVRTLRYHVIPHRRRSFHELHTLPSPFLHTLLPHHSLLLANTATLHHNSSALSDALMVDGVRISAPDLFLGPTFAVHGIDGILVTGLTKFQDFEMNSAADGLGISFQFTPPPILDFWNTNHPTIPSSSAAEPLPTSAAESWKNNDNNPEEKHGGGGKRRKRRHKRRRKYGAHPHGHRSRAGTSQQL